MFVSTLWKNPLFYNMREEKGLLFNQAHENQTPIHLPAKELVNARPENPHPSLSFSYEDNKIVLDEFN